MQHRGEVPPWLVLLFGAAQKSGLGPDPAIGTQIWEAPPRCLVWVLSTGSCPARVSHGMLEVGMSRVSRQGYRFDSDAVLGYKPSSSCGRREF